MKTAALTGIALLVLAAVAAIVLTSVLGGGDAPPIVEVPDGDPEAGRAAIESYGCPACHTIDGVDSTDKYIGPPLVDLGERRYIAGDEPNQLDVLIRWIQDPQEIEPGTIMPDLGVSESEARDIAAYLYGDG